MQKLARRAARVIASLTRTGQHWKALSAADGIWLGTRALAATSSGITSVTAAGLEEKIVGAYTPVTKALWSERAERLRLAQSVPNTPLSTEVAPKPPHRIRVTYPFSTDGALAEQYRNPFGHVRIGRLLEDLDSLAGNVAFSHSDEGDPGAHPPTLVTASVDAIHTRGSIPIDRDIHLSGCVVWTGKSSLDIRMEVLEDGGTVPILVALMTFVAVDPLTRRSTPINQVVPQTPAERQMYKERQELAVARKAARTLAANSQRGVTTSGGGSTSAWADAMLAEARQLIDLPALGPRDAVLMPWTELENTFTCQPQQRNMDGRIFGGFLMRRAYELAWATAHVFTGSRPVFAEVDEITFQRPVNVGDLVRLRSRVLAAVAKPAQQAHASVHVQVVATVIRPELATSSITNTFHYVFEAPLDEAGPAGFKRVLPSTAEEAALLTKFHT